MRHLVLVLSVSGALLAGCASSAESMTGPPEGSSNTPRAATDDMRSPGPSAEPLRPLAYVALGDSYTIGTALRAEDRWPNQLVRALEPDFQLRLQNLGVNGYTSAQLMSEELPQVAGLDTDLVSVQIGANDVVQAVPIADYRTNVAAILDELHGHDPAMGIVVVSTPDFSLTEEGSQFGDPARQRQRIHRFNEVMADEARSRRLVFVDIGPVADRVPDDPTLVARDGLHPSSKQYAGWVELIAPVVRGMLEERARR